MSENEQFDALFARLTAIEAQQQAILLGQKQLYRQVEALFALYHQIDFHEPVLGFRGWAVSPDFAAIFSELIHRHQPQVILELGCGLSTVIAAYAVQQVGQGHIYSVEHQAEFADKTRAHVEQHQLSAWVTIIHAPLKSYDIDSTSWPWYDTDALAAVPDIDLLVVDGPPQYDNPTDMARYPALPLLFERLSAAAIILLDDADRPPEARTADRWQSEFPLTLVHHYDSSYGDTEKGVRVFKKG